MSDYKLTDADLITVQSFYDASWCQDRTDELEADRWSKYGNDRLYINSGIPKADKYSLYIDLETHEIVSDNTSKHSGGSVEIDGDTATVTIEESGDTEHEITLSLNGEEFETSEDDNEPEVVTDGGQDVTKHVDDETIEDAIDQHDDPDHEDALTVADVRDLLAHVQMDAEMVWGESLDNIERDETTVVAQDGDVVVLDTGEHDLVRRALETYNGQVTVDGIAERVVSTVHHRVAEAIAPDRNWGVSYAHVVRLPSEPGAGQEFVEAVINGLISRDVSPGQAWAYYGVEIRGVSRNKWAKRCGYADHSAVSEAVRKANRKLP